ncbi:TPA: hypothetical protein QH074_004300 [Enterobacter hormaechei subsp. steigerwaltii]|nr:hypothetical protein [Enterobacter hormaechei subsp. steigerwaltii]
MSKTIYVVMKSDNRAKYDAYDLSQYIQACELVRETPKGYRLKSRGVESVYLRQNYDFFHTFTGALEHVATMANEVAAELGARKLTFIQLLCDAHDALKRELAK